ncbi:hypothetical protein D9619_001356 [Psilocybe cf. subviscida]|uniref:Uncharacterized protein n=1 Tax=Psilocybe cf. subviscida TaxID=2480587 RepID=A0A8H5BDW4_9AGAR|nr:hypothetical protein D9619_001356 [Psilocybe cf. subviscida]
MKAAAILHNADNQIRVSRTPRRRLVETAEDAGCNRHTNTLVEQQRIVVLSRDVRVDEHRRGFMIECTKRILIEAGINGTRLIAESVDDTMYQPPRDARLLVCWEHAEGEDLDAGVVAMVLVLRVGHGLGILHEIMQRWSRGSGDNGCACRGETCRGWLVCGGYEAYGHADRVRRPRIWLATCNEASAGREDE